MHITFQQPQLLHTWQFIRGALILFNNISANATCTELTYDI